MYGYCYYDGVSRPAARGVPVARGVVDHLLGGGRAAGGAGGAGGAPARRAAAGGGAARARGRAGALRMRTRHVRGRATRAPRQRVSAARLALSRISQFLF